jgi:hypothetical protein
MKQVVSGGRGLAPFRLLERWVASPLFWAVFLVLGLGVRFRQYLYGHSYAAFGW